MIEVSGLTKTYGNKRGITDISFTINEGEIVGFLGPNGAGKSTTMNVITGYLSATAGAAKVAGIDILENPLEAKKHIGYLPQDPPLYLDMTVEEYLNFIYDIKGVKKADESRKAHIDRICEMVGITQVRSRVIGNLSGGYKQRCGLAQALVGDPDVLILDEPTVGLDPKQIIEIRNVIKDLGRNRTIILSTHILQEVSAVCERVLVINNGRLVADDTPTHLSALLTGEHKLEYRIAGPKDKIVGVLRSVDGVKVVTPTIEAEPGAFEYLVESAEHLDVRKLIFSALSRAGYPVLLLKNQDLSLEDVFIQLTADQKSSAKRG
ncbi:MAG: ATP-binding cassette domain-containing protein [Oscillospiraceae bacterium]|nr:ATP-binding cassette domain-containing protein [Oscillospiraceae bacterium]